MYHEKCPSELCDKNYIGGSGQGILESVKDHNGRDHKSYILKHSHILKLDINVKIFWFLNTFQQLQWKLKKQKIAESLLIKQLYSTLKIHGKLVPLKLFN